MKFRDDKQRNLALRVLLQHSGLGWLWTEEGPAKAWAETLEPPDAVMLLFARYASGDADVSLVSMRLLKREQREQIFSLLLAAEDGPSAIDRWIDNHRLMLRGDRLKAMRTADEDRWRAAVLDAIHDAEPCNLDTISDKLGVGRSTFYRWLDDASVKAAYDRRRTREAV